MTEKTKAQLREEFVDALASAAVTEVRVREGNRTDALVVNAARALLSGVETTPTFNKEIADLLWPTSESAAPKPERSVEERNNVEQALTVALVSVSPNIPADFAIREALRLYRSEKAASEARECELERRGDNHFERVREVEKERDELRGRIEKALAVLVPAHDPKHERFCAACQSVGIVRGEGKG